MELFPSSSRPHLSHKNSKEGQYSRNGGEDPVSLNTKMRGFLFLDLAKSCTKKEINYNFKPKKG